MSGTNIITNGSGTAADPFTFNFHTYAPSIRGHPVITIGRILFAGAVLLLVLYFRKRSKSSK